MNHDHSDLLDLLLPNTLHRLMFTGESGTGKSTSARQCAQHLHGTGTDIYLIHADPGRTLMDSPPGSVALARWRAEDDEADWHIIHTAYIASMDCLRHRMRLLTCIAHLLEELADKEPAHIILDAPGITRGPITAELIESLAALFRPTQLFHMTTKNPRHTQSLAMIKALEVQSTPLKLITPHPMAKRPSKGAISSQRMQRWLDYLGEAPRTSSMSLQTIALRGIIDLAPPITSQHFAVAHGARGESLGLVLISGLTATHVEFVHPESLDIELVRTLFVRDMILDPSRDKITTLTSDEHLERTRQKNRPPTPSLAFTPRERPIYRIDFAGSRTRSGNSIRPTIVGHLFEDPMVVLRLEHRQRCFFLDLGEVRQVPTKMIHQTTHILLSHAHLDHFGDFPWLLRRMAGHAQAMHVYGPPGVIERVANMVHAFTWDRVEDRGPRFDVREIHPDRIERALVQAGVDGISKRAPETRRPDDIIIQEPRQTIRAITLDHGGLESIAYSIEEPNKFGVRGNVLRERGWTAGPWLGELKAMAAERRFDEELSWQDRKAGPQTHLVRTLHDEILIAQPGQKIVYATDFSTSTANHDAVVAFASDADVLMCEASFAEEDREQAERTGHMCGSNTGRIAREANVGLLVPFHLSVRYESCPEVVYAEILEEFDRVLIPATIQEVLTRATEQQPQ